MTPALDALVANDRAILDALTEGPTLFADWRRTGVHYLVSLDPSKPGRWRVTRFDADGPTGHIEAPGFREAAREARGMGAALATARGTAPCWLCGAPCAPSLDAEGPPRCADRAQCFARQCAPPGGPASPAPNLYDRDHPADDPAQIEAMRLAVSLGEHVIARQLAGEAIDQRKAWERAHPAGTGACPEDEPCDACAAAYAEADADADARDNEEESETTQ